VKRFLILSHARSGTLYTTCMFEKIGLHVGHEVDEKHIKAIHGVDTYYDGIVSGVFKNMDYAPQDFDVVLHQTRHPLYVISSCRHAQGRLGHANIKRFAPEKLKGLPKDLLYRMMLSWIIFTDMADRLAVYRYRLESLHDEFLFICTELLDIPTTARRAPHMMQRQNMTRHRMYNWADLEAVDKGLTDRIKEKTIEYGYTLKGKVKT